MSSRSSLAVIPRTKAGIVALAGALFILSILLQYVAAAQPRAALAADAPVVTLESGVNGCMGVLPTPGSANTNKRLIGGSLTPGGSATFEISFPVDPSDVAGRTTFVITDCVFIDGKAALKYSVSFVPNTENFVLTFTLQIPAGTPLGSEYCNYAKTTAAPSSSQASNRKAGPACFIVGGDISVLKTNQAGDPLAGAVFHVVCTLPTTEAFLPATIINGDTFTSSSGAVITDNATTGDDGLVVIQAPVGTSCVITETTPPDGYDLPADPSVTLVATAGGVTHTFVDPPVFVPAPALTISKGVSLSADGPFAPSLTTTIGTTVHYRITITNTGNVELTNVTLADNLFQTAVDNCDVPSTLAVGAHFDCNYTDTAAVGTKTNTATADSEETPPSSDTASVTVGTGSLKVTKLIPNVPEGFTGSFGVRVSCEGLDPVNATITFPDPGFITVDDIPAGTTCIVIETSRSDPPDGFQWAGSIVSDPVTIEADTTSEATITNGLIALQATPVLSILKGNNAANPAAEGDTVTYKLVYAVADGPVANGIITDKLPAGVTYVAGSASSDAQFTFVDFNVTTPGALTWKAATVSGPGTLTYKVTIDAGAAKLAQPLTNTATIDSDDTEPVSVSSDVFVAAPPAGETSVPTTHPKTPPPTDVAGTTDSNVSGGSMLFILLGLVGLGLALVFVAPAPASIRKRR